MGSSTFRKEGGDRLGDWYVFIRTYPHVRRAGSEVDPNVLRRLDVQAIMASSVVYFEGEWSSEDVALVEAAAKEVEAAASARVLFSTVAPWVALAYPGREEDTYLASRHGAPKVLRAESARDLAKKIRRFGQNEQGAIL